MSILQIGLGSQALLPSLLSVLGTDTSDTTRFTSYLISDKDTIEVEKAAEDFEKLSPKLSFKSLDFNINLQEQNIKAGSVDIIVASIDFCTVEEKQLFLRNVQASLKGGGKILIHEAASSFS